MITDPLLVQQQLLDNHTVHYSWGNMDIDSVISLKKCRKVLCAYGDKYTDEEVIKIRALMFKLCKLEYRLYMEKKYGTKAT